MGKIYCTRCGKSLTHPNGSTVIALQFQITEEAGVPEEDMVGERSFARFIFGKHYEAANRPEGINICHECYITRILGTDAKY